VLTCRPTGAGCGVRPTYQLTPVAITATRPNATIQAMRKLFIYNALGERRSQAAEGWSGAPRTDTPQ